MLTRVLVGTHEAGHRWMTTHGIRPGSRDAPIVVNSFEAIQRRGLANISPIDLSMVELHDADPSVAAQLRRMAGLPPR